MVQIKLSVIFILAVATAPVFTVARPAAGHPSGNWPNRIPPPPTEDTQTRLRQIVTGEQPGKVNHPQTQVMLARKEAVQRLRDATESRTVALAERVQQDEFRYP